MKKIKLLFALLLGVTSATFAQQDGLFSQYMFNTMLINPAYAGSRDVISLNALYRKQWVNVPGAPETMTFSADAPIKKEKMGLGLTFFNDKIGVTNSTGVYGNYAYRIRLSNNSTLSMGVNLGMTYYTANLTSVDLDNPNDKAFGTNISKWMPNLGLGMFYNTDKFYIGLSMPHILNNKLTNDPGVTARQYRQAYLLAGYVFDLSHKFKLRPSALLKEVYGAPIQLDLNANLWIYDLVGVGISYRSLDAPLFMLEVQLNDQLRFGYAFDYSTTITPQSNLGRTTHEVMLRYEFGYDKAKILTPRYF